MTYNDTVRRRVSEAQDCAKLRLPKLTAEERERLAEDLRGFADEVESFDDRPLDERRIEQLEREVASLKDELRGAKESQHLFSNLWWVALGTIKGAQKGGEPVLHLPASTYVLLSRREWWLDGVSVTGFEAGPRKQFFRDVEFVVNKDLGNGWRS